MKYIWRLTLLSLSLAVVLLADASKSTDIRSIDFKNFSFPWDQEKTEAASVPSHWRWISSPPALQVRVKNGIHHFSSPGDSQLERERAPLISVDSVTYGVLKEDGIEVAAVHLNYSTGGTANWDYLYVYALHDGRPRLLGRLESGSRADGGLVQTAISNGFLVLDFADARRRVGDCCSDGYIRIRYRWRTGRFIEEGPREHGDLDLNAR